MSLSKPVSVIRTSCFEVGPADRQYDQKTDKMRDDWQTSAKQFIPYLRSEAWLREYSYQPTFFFHCLQRKVLGDK